MYQKQRDTYFDSESVIEVIIGAVDVEVIEEEGDVVSLLTNWRIDVPLAKLWPCVVFPTGVI